MPTRKRITTARSKNDADLGAPKNTAAPESNLESASFAARKMARSLYFLASHEAMTVENLRDQIHQRNSLRRRVNEVRRLLPLHLERFPPHSPAVHFRGRSYRSWHHAAHDVANDLLFNLFLGSSPGDVLWNQHFPIVSKDMREWEMLEMELEKEFDRAMAARNLGKRTPRSSSREAELAERVMTELGISKRTYERYRAELRRLEWGETLSNFHKIQEERKKRQKQKRFGSKGR